MNFELQQDDVADVENWAHIVLRNHENGGVHSRDDPEDVPESGNGCHDDKQTR